MSTFLPNMRCVALVAMAAAGLGTTQAALAAGTDPGGTRAGTSVLNQATVDYDVGGVAQTQVLSDNDGNPANGANATEFVVDRKLDILVSERSGGYNSQTTPTVVPGMDPAAATPNGAVLAWTVTNEGNQVQDFIVTVASTAFDPFAGTDNFDANAISVFVDVDGDNLFDPAIDTATFIDELDINQSITVFAVAEIDASQADGDIAAYVLSAQVAEGGTAGGAVGAAIAADDSGAADTTLGVEDVFADDENTNNGADAVNDGMHSSEDAFRVTAATLAVVKSSLVLSDPFTCPAGVCPPGANPKAIPGAVIEYRISVTNAPGAATASNLVISDNLTNEIVGGGGSESIDFLSDQYGGTGDIQLVFVDASSTTTTTDLTELVDADNGQFAANVVSVNSITLLANESAEVRFRVEIQ